RMARRIMGMGDIQGLAEKVRAAGINEDVIKPTELSGKQFNLETLLKQFEQIEKLGPLDKLASMIPGLDKIKNFSAADINSEDSSKALKRNKAIIQAMTPAERRNPKIIKGSRRRRIAEGSGTSVQMVNQLLAQYEQMKKLFKTFSSNSRGGRGLKSLFGFGR
ncbi:MAG: signal recognition particle protein, partial [Synergistaceae bacterium]|nr:signal recognition particle protein [Synergistaceae bacterium]